MGEGYQATDTADSKSGAAQPASPGPGLSFPLRKETMADGP